MCLKKSLISWIKFLLLESLTFFLPGMEPEVEPEVEAEVEAEFESIPSLVLGPGGDFGAEIPGCDCCLAKNYKNCTECSCAHFGPAFLEGKLFDFSVPIIECHAKCRCAPEFCQNRLVGKIEMPNLEIRETPGKGRGVFAKEKMQRGQFICEYSGELIGLNEARKRMENQQKSAKMNYILIFR